MVYIDNRQDIIEVDNSVIELMNNVVKRTLAEEEVEEEVQISIILVNNEEIHKINKEFRNVDRHTDVLSFPMLDYPEGKVFKEVYKNFDFDESFFDGEELVLGDMAISLEKTLEQSKEYEHSFEREIAYLTVHSILHLLGYDHMAEDDKKRMREREEYILEKLNIKRI
jgi:probable rRNA maturation factor